jgi:hypothetical protein
MLEDLTVGFVFQDYRTYIGIWGLEVRVCQQFDADCLSPSYTATTLMDGTCMLDLPTLDRWFHGYIQVSGSSYITDRIFIAHEIQPGVQLSYGEITTADVDSLLEPTGLLRDDRRALLSVTSVDCVGVGVPGITVDIDGYDTNTALVYWNTGALSNTAMSTDFTGLAVFVNAVPGPHRITTVHAATGRTVASFDLTMAAGTMTSVALPPTPTR